MAAAPVQIEFTVEFASFVVAAGGFALVLLRAQNLGRRPRDEVALALGFAALAVVAFINGALLAPVGFPVGTGVQAAGLVLLLFGGVFGARLALGARPLRPVRPSVPGKASAASGTALLCAGALAEGASLGTQAAAPLVAAVLLGVGALAIGAALVLSSRRSIAGRVAASAGFTLLALVLVLSVALSAVLSSTVQNEAIRSLDAQAAAEVTQVNRSTLALGPEANLLSNALDGDLALPVCATVPTACIVDQLPRLAKRYFPHVAVLWASPGSSGPALPQVVATSSNATSLLGLTTPSSLVASGVVTSALALGKNEASAEVVGGTPVSVAAVPAYLRSGSASKPTQRLVGAAVVVAPLDASYLGQQAEQSTSLALLGPGGVLARAGALPLSGALTSLVTATLASAKPANRVIGSQFVAIQPILDTSGTPVMVLVAATSTHTVELSRDSLFRTLFLIALGGTLLALLLASTVGDRIGSGLRRLTVAADAIRSGGRGVRAGVDTGDEVGELGVAFDSMATSIDDKTAALRRAADDEAALRSRLEAVVAGMGEALLAVDEFGRITDFNQAAEELLGVNAAGVLGEPVDEVVALLDEDGSDLSAKLRRPPGLHWSVDGVVLRRGAVGLDGRQQAIPIPVAVAAGEVRGRGTQGTGVVFVIRDLRQERQVEQMKSEFLSRVGHELRTPLTGIMGFSELLARSEVSPDRARVWHKEILGQSKRLLRTVEMLEFFASAGAGRVSLRRETLDPGALVDDLAAAWSARVNGSRKVLRRVARNLPRLDADRRWLSLAIDELVDNAVKFSSEGGQVVVRVEAGPGGRSVEFSVIDEGKGMSGEEAAQAFTDFAQGDSSDTRRYGGLGLGLSLVQRVAEGHGGQVTCESVPGAGSRFSILIPAAVDAEPVTNEKGTGVV